MPLTAIPPFPAIGDANFNTLAYNWAVFMAGTGQDELDALVLAVDADATAAAASAATATTQVGLAAAQVWLAADQVALATTQAVNSASSAATAAATAGAATWVNGGTYVLNQNAISQINFQTYRKKTASSVTVTDPSADATNWAAVVPIPVSTVIRSARTSNTILAEAARGSLIDITSGTFTQTFTAAATLGSGWYCYIRNSGTGDVTLDPNGAETIDGAATLALAPGEARMVQCSGSAFFTILIEGAAVGDFAYSSRVPPFPQWLPCDGATYLQSSYTRLYAELGLLGFTSGATKFSNPATLPTGLGDCCSWDAAAAYLAVGHAVSPFMTVYSRSGTTLTKLSNPATLPTSQVQGVAWDATGEFLAVANDTTPWVTVYQRSGSTLTKLTDPPGFTGNNALAVSWDSSSTYLAVAHEGG